MHTLTACAADDCAGSWWVRLQASTTSVVSALRCCFTQLLCCRCLYEARGPSSSVCVRFVVAVRGGGVLGGGSGAVANGGGGSAGSGRRGHRSRRCHWYVV